MTTSKSHSGLGRNGEQFMIRMPPGLRDELKAAARSARRSMNAEVVRRIENSGAQPSPLTVATNRGAEKFIARLPPGLREALGEAANANGRSMNAEIVLRLLSDTTQRTEGAQEADMARTDPTVYMKLPADLKASVEAAAAASRRSITAEIVHRLTLSLSDKQAAESDSSGDDFAAAIQAGRDIAPLGLRMPSGLKALVISASLRNGRSMNAEICDALAERYGKGSAPTSRRGPDRDTLAAMAMQGLCAAGAWTNGSSDGIAKQAHAMADAMLRAREGGAA